MYEKIKSNVLEPVRSAVKWCFSMKGYLVLIMVPLFILNIAVIASDFYTGNTHDASLRIPTGVWIGVSIVLWMLVIKGDADFKFAKEYFEIYRDRNEYLEESNEARSEMVDEAIAAAKEVIAENNELKAEVKELKEKLKAFGVDGGPDQENA